ncbi:integral membrane protein GPR137C isoform X2 [Chionomys nivalis]|uniref:integral membrane protein GPR137C isoform X2 n=1 Tax=Chionomys nivalis TaxID=269649 RepID=UPI0025914EAF|nr:integral membrane protein GPR137C isoform X2 [Chionomys nivalis]
MRVSVPGPAPAAVPTAGREPSTPGGGAVAASGAAVPGSVQLALSVLHALLYAALFAFAYLQLWRLLLYRERRLSYQSLCLFLCLAWAALRTTLFSAAFSLSGSLPVLRPPSRLHFFPHWLLYCFPSCLQFSTLCLLNLYLAEGMSLCQTVVVGSVVILLYSSRACYNLVVIAISQDSLESPFNYGWDNLSDKARGEDGSGGEYIVFGMVLFLWEHVPAWSVVLFFRAQRLNQNLAPAGIVSSHSYSSRAFFFDNPRRYDSDDDLPRLGSSREGSLSNSQSLGWYGTMAGCGSGTYTVTPPLNGPVTDTAPLLFTCSNLDLRSHHRFYVTPQN